MTKEEFQKRMIAVLSDAMKEGFLHQCVIMANTSGHHLFVTNMGQRTTVRYILHMTEHTLGNNFEGMTAYNLSTGEEFGEEEAAETFATGVAPKPKKRH